MQNAFEAFMLGTSKRGPAYTSAVKGVNSREGTASDPSPTRHHAPNHPPSYSSNPSKISPNRRAQERAEQIFWETLSQNFLWIDDQLLLILQSITNLRQRCWSISKSLALARMADSSRATSEHNVKWRWRAHGYRCSRANSLGAVSAMDILTLSDLHLGLDHDLRQHERMLAEFRKFMALLSSSVETVGRRLEDIYQLQLATSSPSKANTQHEKASSLLERPVESTESCLDVYRALARELYRKQLLSQALIESVRAGLLFDGDRPSSGGQLALLTSTNDPGPDPPGSSQSTVTSRNARRVAQHCVDVWPRTHRSSELFAYQSVLQEAESKMQTSTTFQA